MELGDRSASAQGAGAGLCLDRLQIFASVPACAQNRIQIPNRRGGFSEMDRPIRADRAVCAIAPTGCPSRLPICLAGQLAFPIRLRGAGLARRDGRRGTCRYGIKRGTRFGLNGRVEYPLKPGFHPGSTMLERMRPCADRIRPKGGENTPGVRCRCFGDCWSRHAGKRCKRRTKSRRNWLGRIHGSRRGPPFRSELLSGLAAAIGLPIPR